MKEVVPFEQAKSELQELLEKRFQLPSTRTGYAEVVNGLAEPVSLGVVSVDVSGFTMTQKLLQPIVAHDGTVICEELVYKRVSATERNVARAKAIKKGDNAAHAMAELVTGQPASIFLKLDTEDENIFSAIMVFFI